MDNVVIAAVITALGGIVGGSVVTLIKVFGGRKPPNEDPPKVLPPTLVAKFREKNGEICYAPSKHDPPEIWIELWVEHAPPETRRVAFEIPDEGFEDSKWQQPRTHQGAISPREFLTDEDMRSYGDIKILARSIGSKSGNWKTESGLYDALRRYYGNSPTSAEVRRALKQIQQN